jgi:hypothetical protein
VTRAKQGTLQGGVHLVNENGAWKVDALDTSLMGVSLTALGTLDAFCTALKSQSYETAYGMLSSEMQTSTPKELFQLGAKLQDKVDGTVTACSIAAVSTGNTDTTTNLRVTLTRSTHGDSTGDLSMTADSTGAWKISKLDPKGQGTDLGPYETGLAFCGFLALHNFAGAYAMLSSDRQKVITQAAFTAAFTLPANQLWACVPNDSTYKVSGTTASLDMLLVIINTATGTPVDQANFTVEFVAEGGAWKIDSITEKA